LLNHKRRLVLFVLYIITLLTGLIAVILRGVRVETDILKLMPQSETTELSGIVDQFSRNQTGEMVFLFTAPSDSIAAKIAQKAQDQLTASNLFSSINGAIRQEDQQAWYNCYFPARFTLLTKELRAELSGPTPGESLKRTLYRSLYAPIPDFYGTALEHDPFQLFPTFLQNLFDLDGDLINGFPVIPYDSLSAVVFTATLTGSPFDQAVQIQAEQLITTLKATAISDGGNCNSTGIVRFAAEAFQQAKKEMSLIGTLSLLAVLVILLAAFRSLRLVVVGSLPILLGILTGFVATALLFPDLHVIALSMGGSLTGIAIDYSLHYLAHIRWSGSSPTEVLKKVFPGITLGALTTLIGYGALAFGGFPGLQQIALFTGAGLIGSWITVVLGFPLILSTHKKIALPKLPSHTRFKRPAAIVLVIILTLISIAGISQFRTDDSLEALRTPMGELDREEVAIRKVAKGIESSRFIVVSAPSRELLLQRCEQATLTLDSLIADSVLAGYISVSQVIPSAKRAEENRQLFKGAALSGSIADELINLGFDPAVPARMDSLLNLPTKIQSEQFLASPISKPWRNLFVHRNDSSESAIILLREIVKPQSLKMSFTQPHAIFLDRIESIASTLGIYRHDATKLVFISYGLILILLMFRYGIFQGIRCFSAPVLAGTAVIGGLILAGESINFMHIMSLLLVLGIGIDYSIFFAEGSDDRNETTMAVLLSALSTILAFGVLFLSTTPALQAIGLVITPGILFSVLLAMLFSSPPPTTTRNNE